MFCLSHTHSQHTPVPTSPCVACVHKMQRFLVKQPKVEEESKDKVKALVDHLKATAGQHRHLSERPKYRMKPWFNWDTKERMEAAGLDSLSMADLLGGVVRN